MIMAKAKFLVDNEGKFVGLRIDCPGCGYNMLPVTPCPEGYEPSDHSASKHKWSWNGSLDSPTLTPSVLIKTGHHIDGDQTQCWCNLEERLGVKSHFKCMVCHSFVTDGRIAFLGDCTHEFAGQTVDLPDVDMD